jgi:hypothetical protein
MVRWAQLSVARYAGDVLGPELSANIRAVPLDVEKQLELVQISREEGPEQTRTLYDFIRATLRKVPIQVDIITIKGTREVWRFATI